MGKLLYKVYGIEKKSYVHITDPFICNVLHRSLQKSVVG
jgi:hypothetical protein